MNISDLSVNPGSVTLAPTEHAFSFESMSIDESALPDIRHALYHSSGPGYFIFPGFVNSVAVNHMRQLWATADTSSTHALFKGKHQIFVQCPNYSVQDASGNKVFYNFFWNPPLDELTCTVSFYVQVLRNRVSGRIPFAEIFPYTGKSAGYRVIISRDAKTWIAPHRDYLDHQRRFEKNRYDLSRLQATLVLADKGPDYHGEGFRFELNNGRTISFGTDVPISAGDLILWRYNNLHSVENISTEPGQFGFMRIIYPFENVAPVQSGNNLLDGIKSIVRSGRHVVRSIVRR